MPALSKFRTALGVTRDSRCQLAGGCRWGSYLEPTAGRVHLTSALFVNEETGKLPGLSRRSDLDNAPGSFIGRCQAQAGGQPAVPCRGMAEYSRAASTEMLGQPRLWAEQMGSDHREPSPCPHHTQHFITRHKTTPTPPHTQHMCSNGGARRILGSAQKPSLVKARITLSSGLLARGTRGILHTSEPPHPDASHHQTALAAPSPIRTC